MLSNRGSSVSSLTIWPSESRLLPALSISSQTGSSSLAGGSTFSYMTLDLYLNTLCSSECGSSAFPTRFFFFFESSLGDDTELQYSMTD